MEESCEIHEEDKVHPENNKKRILKTPSQVEALENLYNEHKYPTESLKQQLAEEIGLSEKQVSGWFCHRRLKDKNMLRDEARVMGRQELSSGIVQDRGSAFKQDSCSSTIPGEYKYFDPREVESRRFCQQNTPTEDPAYKNRGQHVHARNHTFIDNTSGSTSASPERPSSQSKYPYEMEPLRYVTQNSNYTSMNIDDLKPRGRMIQSDYLNSQDDIESAAILAVKRQLGRHFREDGPPLGVKFESLPPSAFDAPIEDALNGPCYVGNPVVPKSVGVLKVHKEPNFDTGNSQFKRGRHPHSPYHEGEVQRIRLEPGQQNDCRTINYQSLGKSSLTNCKNYGTGQYALVDNVNGDTAEGTRISNKSRKHGIRSLQSVERVKSKPIIHHNPRPYDKQLIASGSSSPRLHSREDSSSYLLQKGEYFKGGPPVIHQYDECLGTEQSEHAMEAELGEESLFRTKRKSKEHSSLRRAKKQLNKEIRRRKAKQSDEYLLLDNASKTPSPLVLPWETQMKRYAGEIPTSFSDDETAGVGSSTD